MGRKSSSIILTAEERDYLETLTRARTIQAQTVNRARILLLKADGFSIDDIADKVGINRKSVMLCLKKYADGGVENALFDAPGCGRNAEITDEEKELDIFKGVINGMSAKDAEKKYEEYKKQVAAATQGR